MDIPFDLHFVESSGKDFYRKTIRNKIREAALKYLQAKQQTHSKVKNIKYTGLETQDYLKSPIFSNEETSLLFALRTRTARSFKANFSNLYGGRVECPLKCWNLSLHEPPPKDDQEHLLVCNKVTITNPNMALGKVTYDDLFGDIARQKEVISLFLLLITERERLQKVEDNPPGDNLDPSSGSSHCCSSTIFTSHLTCIDDIAIGK